MVFNFRKNKKTNAETESDSAPNGHQQRIVVDGRGYEKEALSPEEIYDLKDVVEDNKVEERLYEAILSRLSTIVEQVARETVPEIAERIIKEEIQKIKENSQ
jgi:hypothetical protein